MKLGSSTRGGMLVAVLAALLLALSIPAVATARITVPPGSTEGDQYFEQAPNGGGSGAVNNGGSGGAGGATGGGAPVAATPDLNKLGPEGQAAAALADANRPPEQLNSHPIPNPPATTSSPTDGEGGL